MTTGKRVIECIKLKRKASGFDVPPYPGELGDKIYHHVSQEAWRLWLDYLTVLINEGRLAVDQAEVKDMLNKEMIQFLNLEHID